MSEPKEFTQISDIERQHTQPRTTTAYVVYHEDGDAVSKPADPLAMPQAHRVQYICFAGLPALLDTRKYNRIFFQPNEFHVSKGQARRWVKSCVACGLMPKHFSPDDVDKGFYFDATIPRSLLYLHLANVRHMDEEPDVVRGYLYLTEKGGMHPYAALVFASRAATGHPGHHYLDGPAYGVSGVESMKVDLSIVMGLREFLANTKKWDAKKGFYNIGAASQIKAAGESFKGLKLPSLTYKGLARPEVGRAVETGDCEILVGLTEKDG